MSLPDWSAIQTDILQEISSHTVDDADYVRFRSVCKSWGFAATKRPQIPWLVASYHEESSKIGLGFCNFPNNEAYCSPLLPEGLSVGKLTVGSSRGWIALIDGAPSISLHNPFTDKDVRLPLLPYKPFTMDYYHPSKLDAFRLAYKVVLSCHPTEGDCVILALTDFEKNLISCRPRDTSWTYLPTVLEYGFRFTDIIFYKGKFHVVSNYRIFVYDPTLDESFATEILPADPLFFDGKIRLGDNDNDDVGRKTCNYKSFLVVSSGDLLLVGIKCPHCIFDCYDPISCVNHLEFEFEVFRVDLIFDDASNQQKMRLIKLESLDGRALFLGKKSMSVSVSTGDSSCCKGNCIYLSISVGDADEYLWPVGRFFLDDNYGIYTEEKLVVFNMEDCSCSWNVVLPNDRMDAWASHWLTPSLC